MAGRTSRDDGAGRRAELLRAAAAVFAKRGYHQATVAEIASEAAVATGTFYLYFPAKEACFTELVDRFYGQVLAEVAQARHQAETLLEKLDQSVAAVLRTFRAAPALATIVLLRAQGAPPAIGLRLAEIEEQLCSLLADDFRLAAELRLLPPGDALLQAHLVVGAMREALIYGLGQPRWAEQDAEVRVFLRRAVGADAIGLAGTHELGTTQP